MDQPFSPRELAFALSRSNGKLAGPDEGGYPLLKNLTSVGKLTLLSLYNKLWVNDDLPAIWRESLVVPIPKLNTPTRDPTRFRPITLTCCAGKVMERMVNRRLKQHLEVNGLLDFHQHAFRHGYGTSTYFAGLSDVLKEACDQGHHAEVVSLDVSKAFNRTWIPLVLKQLAAWGIGGRTLHFVRNFLADRSFRVIIGNTMPDTFPEETGVSQGSVKVAIFVQPNTG